MRESPTLWPAQKVLATDRVTSLLLQRGWLDAGTVIEMRRRPVSLVATSSSIFRLSLNYSPDASGLLPETLILKLPTTDAAAAEYALGRGHYAREEYFYRWVEEPNAPSAIAVSAFNNQQGFLLLEDCAPGRVQHDFQRLFSVGEIVEITRQIARCHARRWGDTDLFAAYEAFPPSLRLGPEEDLSTLLESFLVWTRPVLDKQHIHILEAATRHWGMLHQRFSSARTLLHGDLHPLNIFLNPDRPDDCKFIDWQFSEVGVGVADIVDLIQLHCHPLEQINIDDIVRLYHSELQNVGINYNWRDCLDDARNRACMNAMAPVFLANIPRLLPDAIFPKIRNSLHFLQQWKLTIP